MINLDTPISDENADIFNFKEISEKVSENIRKFNQKESLTISIEGEWGNGKTSLSNLISKKVKNDVVLIHFNPWMIVDFKQLTEYFFSELMKEIQHESFNARLKEDILKDLKKFASIFTPDTVEINTGIFKTHFKPKETFFSDEEESVYDLKQKINGYLSKLDKRILIIIDDIDRLTNSETEVFFRLIKGIADFNNIIYLLLYDKDVVSKSLKKIKEEKGEKYLDKIVQYSISVPKPHKYVLKNELFKRLDNILNEIESNGKQYIFDEYRWSIAMENIDRYIKNLRDVNRITSILAFEYPLISEDVNFVDFFVISLIKIQSIKLYNSIKDNPTLYFANTMYEKKEDAEKRILESFDSEEEFLDYRSLLSSIFPAFREFGLTLNNPHKEKYIANIDNFENYFSFDVSPEYIRHSEYSKIVNLLFNSKYDDFKNEILNLDKNRKSSLFVDMFIQKDLDSLNLGNEKIYKGIMNILKVSDLVKEGVYDKKMSFLGMNPTFKYFSLAFELILKIKDNEKLVKKLMKSNELSFSNRIGIFQRYKDNKSNFTEINISEELLDKFELRIKKRLSKLTLNKLRIDKFGKSLIYRMKDFEISIDRLSKEFNSKIFNSKDDFFEVLEFFKYWQQSSSGNKYLMDKELMNIFFDLEKVDDYITNITSEINEDEKELIEIYHRDKWD